MKDLNLELIVKEIFGESLNAPSERQQQQELRNRLDSAHDKFFERNRLAVEFDHADKVEPRLPEAAPERTITKRLERVPEAKNRLLASIDRFIEQARESVRNGGHHAT